MNDTVTILGRVGSDPNRKHTDGGVPVVNFRVASTQSRYDSKTQRWLDTGTNWYTVSAFRQLAEHAKVSLRSGDAVIVTGRLKLREWESGGKKGISADIDAEAIGHDLRWGTAAFAKAPSASSAQTPIAAQPTREHPAEEQVNAQGTFEASADETFSDELDSDEEFEVLTTAPDLTLAGGSWKR